MMDLFREWLCMDDGPHVRCPSCGHSWYGMILPEHECGQVMEPPDIVDPIVPVKGLYYAIAYDRAGRVINKGAKPRLVLAMAEAESYLKDLKAAGLARLVVKDSEDKIMWEKRFAHV